MTARDHGTARILEWYAGADDDAQRYGAEWYADARRIARRLAREHGTTERTAAGVIAALSPRQKWSANVRAAGVVLEAHRLGLDLPAVGLRRNVLKAWRIAAGERPLDVLGGPKVRAFYRNLTGDLSAVTVDVWAARAAGADPNKLAEPAYRKVADAYRTAAITAGVAPAVLQAVVWCAIRGAHN